MQAPPLPMSLPQPRFFHSNRFQGNYQKPPPYFNQYRQHQQQAQQIEFDGKRLRKAVARKTVDYNSAIVKYLEGRIWQRDFRDRRAIQPDVGYYTELLPPLSMIDNPINAVTTKFVRTSTNKMRCPIFCVVWTPEGRRLVTGASSGEFTLWNGLTFNFETILQAHDAPVRCMVWSHNDLWMVTGDHAGYVKYWQSNMNNVKMFQAHKEPLRGISFCPTDTKFATCSDDGTVRIWDFLRCQEEKILRGHGSDVKCLDWHPQKGLVVSGSKDSQQPIKLWDPKNGVGLATIHAHKSTVTEVKWNRNGNWLLTASRDHLLKLFDIRNMNQEVQTFRGHKKEACSLAWHPVHETLFASGGSDGSVMFWVVGADKEVGGMEQAHDSCVWSLAWHPLGHILCSGSNDHTSKFWTRNRPGDKMRDKYNLNTLPRGQDETAEYDEPTSAPVIPGMGLEYGLPDHLQSNEDGEDEIPAIPGLDFGTEESVMSERVQTRKVPYAKPIPKQFQQQWMENKKTLLLVPPTGDITNATEGPPLNVPLVPQGSLLETPKEHQMQAPPLETLAAQDADHRRLSEFVQHGDRDERQLPVSEFVGDGNSRNDVNAEWSGYPGEFGDRDLRHLADSDLRAKDIDHRNFADDGVQSWSQQDNIADGSMNKHGWVESSNDREQYSQDDFDERDPYRAPMIPQGDDSFGGRGNARSGPTMKGGHNYTLSSGDSDLRYSNHQDSDLRQGGDVDDRHLSAVGDPGFGYTKRPWQEGADNESNRFLDHGADDMNVLPATHHQGRMGGSGPPRGRGASRGSGWSSFRGGRDEY